MATLASTFHLPCGLALKNRIAKAAMTEQLCGDGAPHGAYARLYRAFLDGGSGLVLTGNFMVHRDHREHPRNVVVDDESPADAFARVAAPYAGTGTALVAQLSHPGRQAVYARGGPVAPSASRLQGFGPVFKAARALTADEIDDVIARFAWAAAFLQRAGFHGVQIHAAHGYLLSQFLSPLVNKREDGWGGSLDNRARLLLAIVEEVRRVTGKGFAVMVKLNSADFQKGGFQPEDCYAVMAMLERAGVDLLELSGGSYEAPAMVGLKRASTVQREAYFLEFAERAREKSAAPLMVTGGFRTRTAMEDALSSGACDVIGLARPLAIDPSLPHHLLDGTQRGPAPTARDRIGVRTIDGILSSQVYVENLHRIAAGKEPDARLSRAWALAHALWMAQGL